MITERASDENQCSQKKAVRFDDPLRCNNVGIEGSLDRRQRNVDDGSVDERHARTDDGGSEYPRFGTRNARGFGFTCFKNYVITRWSHERMGCRLPSTGSISICDAW